VAAYVGLVQFTDRDNRNMKDTVARRPGFAAGAHGVARALPSAHRRRVRKKFRTAMKYNLLFVRFRFHA